RSRSRSLPVSSTTPAAGSGASCWSAARPARPPTTSASCSSWSSPALPVSGAAPCRPWAPASPATRPCAMARSCPAALKTMTDMRLPPARLRRVPSRWRAAAFVAGLWLAGSVWAQVQLPRGGGALSLPMPAASSGGATSVRTADFIVALVNSEPITNNEVRQRMLQIRQQFAKQGAALPPPAQLAREVLDRLIKELAQIQQAPDTGTRVAEATLQDAERSIAAQNQMSLEDFRRRLAAEGIDHNRLRAELSNQILLQRVHEREVDARVRITE